VYGFCLVEVCVQYDVAPGQKSNSGFCLSRGYTLQGFYSAPEICTLCRPSDAVRVKPHSWLVLVAYCPECLQVFTRDSKMLRTP